MLLALYRLTRKPRSFTNTEGLLISDNEYEKSVAEIERFWSRFPVQPDFAGKTVLDLGSGLGAMVYHVARAGASRVVGVDILEEYLRYSSARKARERVSEGCDVEFTSRLLSEFRDSEFDYILSKDSFEHILPLEALLGDIRQKLKPDGKLIVGFSPLYRSIRGDHYRTRTRLPWGHVLFPERVLIQGLNELYPEKKISSIADLGLNQLSLREFKAMLKRQRLRPVYFGINVSEHPAMKLFNLARHIPGLDEFFSQNVYAILERE